MRLINTNTLELKEFVREIPSYAILSHRWTDDEISEKARVQTAVGTKRFYDYSEEAWVPLGGISVDWVWVDTCCIDTRSSAELSEAINSMWQWYENASYCVVHLSDVTEEDMVLDRETLLTNFQRSVWFTRGWTLQELLAPRDVLFCSQDWAEFGSKTDTDVLRSIEKRTGIEPEYSAHHPLIACAAKKLSWASERQTTRAEDVAYCLLGLLNVNMALLYGEGSGSAFRRLQTDFITRSNDESIFAWRSWPGRYEMVSAERGICADWTSILAPSPRCFKGAQHMERISNSDNEYISRTLYHTTNNGLMLETKARKVRIKSLSDRRKARLWERSATCVYLVPLNCRDTSTTEQTRFILALVVSWDGLSYRYIVWSHTTGHWDWTEFWKHGRTTKKQFSLRLALLD